MKLGRKAIKTDSRTLRLSRYLGATLPPAPPSIDWTKGSRQWNCYLNDSLGCCTIAGLAHAIQTWSLNSVGLEISVTDQDVLTAYEAWCGYNPADPSTDVGGIELDVLTAFRKNSLAGHALLAWADVPQSNLEDIRQAIALFGGVYVGMQVPNFVMQSNLDPAVTWDLVADDGGIDGGHAVWVCGYDQSTFTFISWGSVFKMTVPYWLKYGDEVHALLSSLWNNSATGAPGGFNLAQLTADLSAIA